MSKRLVVVMTGIILMAGHTRAQGPAAGNERARLGFLAGSYTTVTTMPASATMPKGATGTGTSVMTWALDSMFIMIDEESMNSLFGKYRGHGLLGFNAQTREYELMMFNNFGDHPSYRGTFSGDTLVLQTRVPAPKHPFDQKLLWFSHDGTLGLVVMNDTGEGFQPVLEQVSTPLSPPPK
jgi:hypothetical protein